MQTSMITTVQYYYHTSMISIYRTISVTCIFASKYTYSAKLFHVFCNIMHITTGTDQTQVIYIADDYFFVVRTSLGFL